MFEKDSKLTVIKILGLISVTYVGEKRTTSFIELGSFSFRGAKFC